MTGTGPQGRITEEDVRVFRRVRQLLRDAAEAERVSRSAASRRQMFEHLTRAHREIPAVTWVEECDFSDVDLKRLVPLVLKAVAESLREFPELNARVEDGELVLLDRYDIGVAVQTEQGLVVPVVHGADWLSLDELDAEVKRLAEAAHAGKLEAGGAARRHVHRHERGQGGRPVRDAADQPSARWRSSASTGSRSARSCGTARSSSAGWGTSRSRSTTASSTASAPPSSGSP